MGNLANWTQYLVGPIDLDKDPYSWRDVVTDFLVKRGAQVLDPTKKSSSIGLEDEDSRLLRKQYKEKGEYDKLAKIMKKVVGYDYRCVDTSDCLICRLDINIPTCGSFYEMCLGEIQRKPILVFSTSGKNTINDWVYGIVELSHIFENMEEMFDYLDRLDKDLSVDVTGRFKIL